MVYRKQNKSNKQVKTTKKPQTLESLSILGDTYSVYPLTEENLEKYLPDDSSAFEIHKSALGLCNNNRGVIMIRPGLNSSRYVSTMLHEVLHSIVSQMCVDLGKNEELVVTQVSQGLAAVLSSNPRLVSLIQEAGKDV